MRTTAALEAATERRPYMMILQKPYVGQKLAISHSGYQILWPGSVKKDERVGLTIRVSVLDMYVFRERTELINLSGAQCLDVWETWTREKVRKKRVMGIYNRAIMEGYGYAIDRNEIRQLIQGRSWRATSTLEALRPTLGLRGTTAPPRLEHVSKTTNWS